ncbi:hypothetical protein XYCOK13_18860 [Xylanibacillus composti]|uniref:Uncharacterized protein n=1 Tax=Xylanibacillus composti TaxID=1572762 RepID=A0A8J4H181_9BACL|nr:hypothetical protein XYCOK13_18860 [Xylanibacillus composti]
MSSEEQGHHFVSQLFVRHHRPVLVLRMHQHGQQVAVILAVQASLLDDAINDLI